MKVKVMNKVKKIAAVATGALFLGATMGAAAVFGTGLSGFGSSSLGYVSGGAVHAVVVVGASAAAQDILGSIDIASALTAQAAATHSGTGGSITIGKLSLSATSKASVAGNGNDTTFGWNPLSANLDEVNWTGSGKQNYTSIENVSFSGATKAYTNGLNVVLPVSSFWLSSYLVNRSNSKAMVGLVNGTGDQWLIGTTSESLIGITGKNYTVGVETTYSNVKVPGSLKVGSNTVSLQGIATITTGSQSNSYNQLEFSVNGGALKYMNFSSTSTVSGVTLTTGRTAVTNTSGTFLSSLAVSSTSLVQNFSSVNKFGLGNYNATAEGNTTAKGGRFLNFSNTAKVKLNYSFSTANSFSLPSSLSTLSLEPLTHLYTGGSAENLTVSVGAAGTDLFVPRSGGTSTLSTFNYTHALSNVAVGVDYRGTLTTSGVGNPDLLLESNQSFFNVSSGNTVTALDEYLYPNTLGAATFANTSGEVTSAPTTFNGKSVRIVYKLPNGHYFALQSTPALVGVNASYTYAANVTTLLNYTASTITNPAVVTLAANENYSFGGYNLTTSLVQANTTALNRSSAAHKFMKLKLSGPTASVTGYTIVPGYSGLYATNGTSFSTATLADGRGTLSFSGTTLTYTDPLGATQAVSVSENKTTFGTYVSTPTNTSANTWGDYVTGAGKNLGAKLVIPTQNYTLALGGSQVISSRTNYTVGQTVSSGELLSIGGASSISASGLFGSGVFPLAQLDSSFVGTTNSVPVVVVGGPAVNTVAQTVLGLSGPIYGQAFTNLTGVHSGQALVQLFTNVSALGHQNAVLVAGYNAGDTLNAAEVVGEFLLGTPVVSLNGTKMILSTSASSYTGVTIISQS